MKIDLNQGWRLETGRHRDLPADVPCSLYSVLLDQGLMEDPYDGTNERKALALLEGGCVLRKTFRGPQGLPQGARAMLRFEAVDTIADILLNGSPLGSVRNFHRRWEFDVTERILEGDNALELRFADPVAWCARADDEYPLFGMAFVCRGYQHLRKPHSMFGWDWGPQLPDMGLPGGVSLKIHEQGRIRSLRIRQRHSAGAVDLDFHPEVERYGTTALSLRIRVTSPDGRSWEVSGPTGTTLQVRIESPELWWPNGYGAQPLYSVEATLLADGRSVDVDRKRIGLRTLGVSTAKDRWGREFCFVVNGVKIFAMGADYIPEDSLLPRISRERTERLVRDCVAANFNCLRVWGGGSYGSDDLYDLCDIHGLVLWQDFMFACAAYRMTPSFEAEVSGEFRDVLERIRHHASLGLLCGNNEMEVGMLEWVKTPNETIRQDYLHLYERLLPRIVSELAPDVFYWPASPSSVGGFEMPNDFDRGDTHYWEVWHGGKPLETYREHHFRFCSEFGFESFPDVETLRSFCREEDLNPYSEVMESHQKCEGGNARIMNYLSLHHRLPQGMDRLSYASQIMQAEAIRYGVEHMRRNRGRCMGAIYWQLNDCWPGASWSSIDYFGRWKALHHAAHRFFAPVLLSVCDEGTRMTLNLSNERRSAASGTIEFGVSDARSGDVVFRDTLGFHVDGLSAADLMTVDIALYVEGRASTRYFWYRIVSGDGGPTPPSTLLLTKPKHFEFRDPDIRATIEPADGGFRIRISSRWFAKNVHLAFRGLDVELSDDFFDVCGEDVALFARPRNPGVRKEDLEKALRIRSVFDVDRKGAER